jgi:TRAP-type C4-dicarboxylate transport system substrate-binding protein
MFQKKAVWIVFVLFVSLLTIPIAVDPAVAKPKPVVIKWADIGPPKGLRPEYLKKAAAEVEKVTEGRVKIKFFWGQSLLKSKDVPAGLRDGFCDAGWMSPTYSPAEIPLLGCMTTLLYAPKGDDAHWITQKVWEMYDRSPALNQELAKLNAKLWFVFSYPAYPMFANMKVSSLSDMKNKVFRVSGEWYVKMVEALGARAETITAAETYSAIDKKIVDGAFCGVEWGKRYSFYEIAKYLNLVNVFAQAAPGPVSIKSLNKMTAADRKAFMDIGRKYSLLYAQALKDTRSEYLEFYKEFGMQMVDFPVSEKEKWATMPAVKALPKKWVETQEKAGRPGKEIMTLWLEVSGLSDMVSLD